MRYKLRPLQKGHGGYPHHHGEAQGKDYPHRP